MPSLPLHNLDPRTRGYLVGRDDILKKIKYELLRPNPFQHEVVVLGLGGMGKTAIARHVAWQFVEDYDKLLPEQRFDVIIWASAKRYSINPTEPATATPPIAGFDDLNHVIERLLGPSGRASDSLTDALRRRGRTLIVLDNLEDVDDDALVEWVRWRHARELPPTASVRVLITMREREVDFGYQPYRLPDLDDKWMREIIERECALAGPKLHPDAIEQLVRAARGTPLAAIWALGLLRSKPASMRETLADLQRNDGEVLSFIFGKVMDKVRQQPRAYDALRALSFFDARSGATLAALAGILGMWTDECKEEALRPLMQLSLVNRGFAEHPYTTNTPPVGRVERFTLLSTTRQYVREELAGDRVGA